MSDRCEPPPELRGRDGWHWVKAPVGAPLLARWHVADNPDTEPLWTSTHHVYSGTPRYAVREWGWRYLSPVLTPTEVEALRAEAYRAGAEAMRERAAREVDCGCPGRETLLNVTANGTSQTNGGLRWTACSRDPCGALDATAIRALPLPAAPEEGG